MGERKAPAHHAGIATRSSTGLTPKKLSSVEPSCETYCDRRKSSSDKLTKAPFEWLRCGFQEATSNVEAQTQGSIPSVPQNGIDKSALPIGEPKRHRSKEHLKFVASQPCLICGRTPSHAHHILMRNPKG
jgi:hypothetical protein